MTTETPIYPIDHLYRGHEINSDGIAVQDGTQSLTYTELVERVNALAAALQSELPKPRARIGVCANNTIDHMTAMLAVYASEHIWVALNPRNGKTELDAIIDATGLDAIIADVNCLDLLTARPDVPIYLGGGADGDEQSQTIQALIQAHKGETPKRAYPDLSETQALKFTGGSTGRPKGVVQSYRVVSTSIATYLDLFNFDSNDVNLCAAPLTHGAAHYLLPILSVGGRHLLLDRPKAPELLDAFEFGGCTTTFMPPTMIYNMMAEPGVRDRDFSMIKHLHYGAAPMPPERIREAREIFNNSIEVIYGQTEAPMLITAMTSEEFEDPRNLASVGRQTPATEVEIRDAEGYSVPNGELGEIVCRGGLVMTEYLDMPDATAETIIDGWLHTGDIGYLDERGYLFIKDRSRDVIISGGFNIYPSDVEAALSENANIAECLVFSLPDDKWGERVEAAVTLQAGAGETEETIIAFAKQQIGSVKAPKRIHIVDHLPRNAVGKVLRREAQRLFGGGTR